MSRAHVYNRDHINTDEIIPARYLNTDERSELAKHCLEDLDAEFVKKAKPGDIIVAGEDFGCGSSREHAVWAIREAGIQTVIAKSFARIFYRNAINNGFYIIESPEAPEKIKDGDELEIDFKAGLIKNKTAGIDIKFASLPNFALEIIKDGGLIEHISKGAGKMPIEEGHKRSRIPMVFDSVDEGVKHLKNRISVARTVRISNIPVVLLEELLPALEGKDVKIILHHGAKPTEKMKEVGDLAIQKSKISSDFNGVEADEGSIYFSDVVFRVTWAEDKILQISTMGYNKWVEWFEMGWRYAEKVVRDLP